MAFPIRKIIAFFWGILFLTACGEGGSGTPKIPKNLPNINTDALFGEVTKLIGDQLNIKIGEPVTLSIPLDVFCSFLGEDAEGCRVQNFKVKFDRFRTYFALIENLPALVISRVNKQGKEDASPGDDSHLLALRVSPDLQIMPAAPIPFEEAKSAVSNFRNSFSGGVKVWTYDFLLLLNLFSTLPQDLPPGFKTVPNYLDFAFILTQERSLQFSIRTRLGEQVISEFFLAEFHPAWLRPCPPECGPNGSYFFPTN